MIRERSVYVLGRVIAQRNALRCRPRFCTVKAILGRGQPGRMRCILIRIMLLAQNRSVRVQEPTTIQIDNPELIIIQITELFINATIFIYIILYVVLSGMAKLSHHLTTYFWCHLMKYLCHLIIQDFFVASSDIGLLRHLVIYLFMTSHKMLFVT